MLELVAGCWLDWASCWVRVRLAPSLSRMGIDRVYPVYYEISFDPIKTHSRETWASLGQSLMGYVVELGDFYGGKLVCIGGCL